jgi:hypothetical protein
MKRPRYKKVWIWKRLAYGRRLEWKGPGFGRGWRMEGAWIWKGPGFGRGWGLYKSLFAKAAE